MMNRDKRMKGVVISALFALTVFQQAAFALSEISTEAKIQINVPAEGTRTRLITFNVTDERHIFFKFLESTQKTGMCSPSDVLKYNSAAEVMSVSFWGEDVDHRITLKILEDTTGKWLPTGFGRVEIYDDPKGFPKYKYDHADLWKIQQWHKSHIEMTVEDNNSVEQTPSEVPSKAGP